jgi:hypothetical protein
MKCILQYVRDIVQLIALPREEKPFAGLKEMKVADGSRLPGAWSGKIKIGPEFFEPLPPEELEGWE